ncbi:MAG: peptide/nickel transport system permease protein [Saprospiraceae bacterium]|jgi:peptide/nickel transport system permease protein
MKDSPNKKAWQRFKRNRPGIFGLMLIAFAVILAFFGYLITPDSTPNSNDQINEIRDADLGFSTRILKVRKNRLFEQTNIFKRMFLGTENKYQLVPIREFQIDEDSIKVLIYQGEDEIGKPTGFALADVIYPVSATQNTIQSDGKTQSFYNVNNEKQTIELKELQDIILKNNLGNRTFWLGTDHFGRDILSRLIIGIRVSLLVGLIAMIISLTIGVFMGSIAGYYGGKTDDFIMLIINTVWSIPTLLLVFALIIALGRGFWQIFLAVGLTMWVDVARIVRGQIISVKNIQFVEAGRSFGFSDFRIIFKHILPNILGPVMVVAAANFATAILIEAGLSYLGFGIQPPQPSWGNMLKDGYGYFISSNIYPALFPGLAIMLMVLAFNLVGNAFRDALDVKTKA